MAMRRFRDKPFTLRQLQYVAAVAEAGGFGAAALACGVSQPSLSAQVAKVEELLGLTLFERDSRAVRLTAEARALLPSLEQLLTASDAFEARAATLADPEAATLRVGLIPTVAPYLLPAAVGRIRTRLPKLTIHWIEAQTATIEAQLAARELDAGLIADPPRHPRMRSAVLGEDAFSLVVPAERGVATPVRPADLRNEELLLLEDGHCLRDQTMAVCMAEGARESPFRATSLATLVQMVAAGLGVTLLPASALAVETARATVRAVPFVEPVPGRTLRLLWPERGHRGALIEQLAEELGAALRSVASSAAA